MNNNTYDFLFAGGGLSAQLVAYRMIQDPAYAGKKILIIDALEKNTNDRTWCFWDTPDCEWQSLITKSWDAIYFGHPEGRFDSYDLKPFQYHMLRSGSFYAYMKEQFKASKQVEWLRAEINTLSDHDDTVVVNTSEGDKKAKKVFSSIFKPDKLTAQNKYQVLQQHFVGWFIETPTPQFDDRAATFMDFSIPQHGNTRFMYILPETPTKALLEYTLFSKDLLSRAEYEAAIADYLKEKNITEYTIVEKEQGCIPMSSYPFHKTATKNILPIGTAGGWTKPSTGFTFSYSSKQSKRLIDFLKSKDDFRQFYSRDRFWYYDLLFIDVLSRKNELGAELFSTLFKRNDLPSILRFLNNETSSLEDLKITLSLPPQEFIKAIWNQMGRKRLFT